MATRREREAAALAAEQDAAAKAAAIGGQENFGIKGTLVAVSDAQYIESLKADVARLSGENLQLKLAAMPLAAPSPRVEIGQVARGDLDVAAHIAMLSISADVESDEIDEDPPELTPDGHAFAAGLERAAELCETVWSGQIGHACARTIREEIAKL